MPRVCTVCRHPQRDDIDAALVERRETFRAIARRFGVTKDAIRRHDAEHVPATLARAEAVREDLRAGDLVGRLLALNRETLAILAAARRAKDHTTALAAIARAERQLELQARLATDFGLRPTAAAADIASEVPEVSRTAEEEVREIERLLGLAVSQMHEAKGEAKAQGRGPRLPLDRGAQRDPPPS